MVQRWSQVLPQGESLAIHGAQVAQGGHHFLEGFPEAQHQSRFGGNGWCQFPGRGQQGQGAAVGGASAHLPLEPFHGFEVVVETHRLGGEHGAEPLPLGCDGRLFIALAPPEVGGEHLDSHVGLALADRRHSGGEQAGAMVDPVVAGDGGEHHVLQSEQGHGIGHPLRFVGVVGARGLAFVHLTEGAAAGANRTPEQERGRAGGVALAAIGASALLADGVEPLLLHHPLHRFQG